MAGPARPTGTGPGHRAQAWPAGAVPTLFNINYIIRNHIWEAVGLAGILFLFIYIFIYVLHSLYNTRV